MVEEESEDKQVWDSEGGIPYEEAQEGEKGTRIALNMMDWDTITATDILALFRSLCTGDKVVTKV